MKYVNKYNSGGLLIWNPDPKEPPTMPAYAPSSAPSSGSAGPAGEFDWIDDDLKKKLFAGGLTNDANALYAQLASIGNQSNNPFLASVNRRNVYFLGAQINQLARSKDKWNQAKDIAEKAGGLGEIAVGNNGEIYVRDIDGIIRGVTTKQYRQNPQLYQGLSVAELLELRDTDSQLTNNDTVFEITNNAIGMSKITASIEAIVKNMAKSSEKETNIYDQVGLGNEFKQIMEHNNATGREPTESELKGFQILEKIHGNPTRYNEVMTSNSSNAHHVERAIQYAWTALGDNAQRKLEAHAAIQGISALEFIRDATLLKVENHQETAVKGLSEKEATKGSGGGSEMQNTMDLNNFQTFVRGTYATGKNMVFNDPEYAAKFEGLVLGQIPLVTPDEKPIGPTTLGNVFKSGYENYVDTENVFFGNTKINPWDWENIVTDGRSSVIHALIPTDRNGNPDNSSLQDFREVMAEYEKQKDTKSRAELQRIFNESGFHAIVREDKSVESVKRVGVNVKPFLITTAYTNSAVKGLLKTQHGEDNTNPENGGLRKLTSTENKNMQALTGQAWTINTGGKPKSIEPNKMLHREKLYKGLVYMPLRDNYESRVDSSFKSGPRADQYREEQPMQDAQQSSGTRIVSASRYDIEEYGN